MSGLKTAELYNKACQGDKNAEKELFEFLFVRFRYFAGQKIGNQQDVEEVVQNALMAVSRKYDKINIDVSFAAWAHRVVSNEVLKHYRSKSLRERVFTRDFDEDFIPAMSNISPTFRMAFLDCVKELSRDYRRYARILNLKYQGFAVAEICEKMSITHNNMYVILSRARSLLKQCMESKEID
ncbi:MAG: RNA polymerase sigma factor [Candidatus Zixiibacteriota bacterium]|nr:MAG: RNA polymerase sigma factor [candidate division Zixibacteria bacterium]